MTGKILLENNRLVSFRVPVSMFREGRQVVADCAMLGLASHGKSAREARESLESVIEVFLEEVIEMGTLAKVLTERGWHRNPSTSKATRRTTWEPPKVTHATVVHASA